MNIIVVFSWLYLVEKKKMVSKIKEVLKKDSIALTI